MKKRREEKKKEEGDGGDRAWSESVAGDCPAPTPQLREISAGRLWAGRRGD